MGGIGDMGSTVKTATSLVSAGAKLASPALDVVKTVAGPATQMLAPVAEAVGFPKELVSLSGEALKQGADVGKKVATVVGGMADWAQQKM